MREKQFRFYYGEIYLTPHQHKICRELIEKDIGIIKSSENWVEETEKYMKEMEEKHIEKMKKIIDISLIMAIVSTITFIILISIYIQ